MTKPLITYYIDTDKKGSTNNTLGVAEQVKQLRSDVDSITFKAPGRDSGDHPGIEGFSIEALRQFALDGKYNSITLVAADDYGALKAAELKQDPVIGNIVKTVVSSHTYEKETFAENIKYIDRFAVPKSVLTREAQQTAYFKKHYADNFSRFVQTNLVPHDKTADDLEDKFIERLENNPDDTIKNALALVNSDEPATFIFYMPPGDLTALDQDGNDVKKLVTLEELSNQGRMVRNLYNRKIRTGQRAHVAVTNSARTYKYDPKTKEQLEDWLNPQKNKGNKAILQGLDWETIAWGQKSNSMIKMNVGMAYLGDWYVMNQLAEAGHEVIAFIDGYSVSLASEWASLMHEDIDVYGIEAREAHTPSHRAVLQQMHNDNYWGICRPVGKQSHRLFKPEGSAPESPVSDTKIVAKSVLGLTLI